MQYYTHEELDNILELHQMWLDGDERGERANLAFAELQCLDLQNVNLAKADLHYANLAGASLNDANLAEANLNGAELTHARLTRADLSGAILAFANLSGAFMEMTNLENANLEHANLRDAALRGAKNLPKLAIAQMSILPEGNDIIGWKKMLNGKICKLLIPAEAKRFNAITRTCRTECAQILEIWDGDKQVDEGEIQDSAGSHTYHVGEILHAVSFSDDPLDKFATGIHFFITRVEAEESFCPKYREGSIYANTAW